MIRRAATVCLLRPGAGGPEVLMVRRADRSAFMGGAYVFPGGALGDEDRSPAAAAAVEGAGGEDLPWRAAALRELAEEAAVFLTSPPSGWDRVAGWRGLQGEALFAAVAAAGIRFAGSALAHLDSWVTPPGPPRRFDTRFYVAEAEAGTMAEADGVEVHDAVWISPARALAEAREQARYVTFPTLRHLELLADFATPADAVTFACSQTEIPRVEPALDRDNDGSIRILLPGDDGYAAAVEAS